MRNHRLTSDVHQIESKHFKLERS